MAETLNVKELVNDPKRVGVLATTDRQGMPNVAVFGSPHMPDDLTLVMGLGDTRTAQNLLETGRGVFMSVLPGDSALTTKGARIYLKVRVMEKEGPNLDQIKAEIRARAGERAAAMIQYAVFFDIEGSRPLIDWGPGRKG
ncbi:MAG: pyridoxamine 5'-phosphate oxidase family protein [Deltaproteobacteria bacterium]|nr:pyridoxamine 5'-phosphate oxidase family protein [Deltaproteobacteria bacterium]